VPGSALFVTGASSGIGAASVAAAPPEYDRVVTVSRREAERGWVAADLFDPASWPRVVAVIEQTLDAARTDHAVLLHCAGTADPIELLVDADPAAYARSVILDFASGPALGQAFLRACHARGVRATLVMCSSPAADKVIPRQAHYCASKAGMNTWAAVAAAEQPPGSADRVITVVPYATLTDMTRAAMAQDPAHFPMAQHFRDTEAAGGFASPADTAAQIWSAIDTAANADVVAVGAVPADPS